MGKSPNGYRGKSKADCAAIMLALVEHRRITIEEIMRDRGLSRRSAYRWLSALGESIPMTVKGGVAVVDDSYCFSHARA